jgi:hypothetical protein
MTGDHGKTRKDEFMVRLEKAKGRLQQSFPEIQQLIRASSAVDLARQIIDPARSIFRQFADDIQLKDLFAKAEALVANADLPFAKAVPQAAPAAETFRDATPADESANKARARKTPAKRARLKKTAPKRTKLKTLSKKKKKRAPKRRVKARS